MKYIVLSTAVIDEIHYADGTVAKNIAGGAGIYALCGMKVWHDDVGIVTGVGADYLGIYGDWYKKNSLTTEGLIVKDEHTPLTKVQYFADGERIETPKYGEDHYKKIEGTCADIEPFLSDATGLYIFKNANPDFWDNFIKLKKKYPHIKVMWEIAADATIPENLVYIKEVLQYIDVLSINETEAKTLLGKESRDEVIDTLIALSLPMIFFRVGSSGSYAIQNGDVCFVPSVQDCNVVDVTGGGNSSSGGFFVGYCETGNGTESAIMGNISASVCIAQTGTPPLLDNRLRAEMLMRKENMKGEKYVK